MPASLCARIPEGVSSDEAAFTVLAAVGLQGLRLAAPTLGENVAVLGLGLVGLLTVQMLLANGCRVLGADFDARKLGLARQFGAETVDLSSGVDPVELALAFSGARGVDAVLITASTESSDPVHQAAQMSRKRGRIVLVGVTGLELSRADFYEKELSFQVSCSYGPGRYDPAYEQGGHDYPLGFVRWTEQRNFEAVLDLMARRKLEVAQLISRLVPIAEAPAAYRLLLEDRAALGVVLTYPERSVTPVRSVTLSAGPANRRGRRGSGTARAPVVGLIGAGNFASLVLLPALTKTPARLRAVAGTGGPGSALAARKYGFEQATSDYRIILSDPQIDAVIIADAPRQPRSTGRGSFGGRQTRLRRKALGTQPVRAGRRSPGVRGRRRPPIDGRLQPSLFPSGHQDAAAAGSSGPAIDPDLHGERRHDPNQPLDARPPRRRRPDHR